VADQNQQNQAAQNADAQRRADEQRRAQQQGQGQQGQQRSGQQQGQQVGQDQARQARRQAFDEEKRTIAERPQQSGNEGSQPTPTQQENDEIRAGLRHIDDKEDDRSGADYVHQRVLRRVDAEESKGKYETR
jgi:hypothetical protein